MSLSRRKPRNRSLAFFSAVLLLACSNSDISKADAGTDADADSDTDADADADTDGDTDTETGTTTGPPDDGFCRAWADCPELEVCDFALGRCERRYLAYVEPTGVTAFKPPAAAAGDVLVVDGHGFYTGLLGAGSVSLSLDGQAFLAGQVRVDENRVVVPLGGSPAGAIEISGNAGADTADEPLATAPSGILPCGDDTPAAAGFWGQGPGEAGPHAAAYVDLGDPVARVTYPAQCGSVRRPPVAGERPLVALLHGDGALYLNYEYLAQFLASWGFVSVMPESDDPDELIALLDGLRGSDLGATVSSVLAGVTATGSVALVGHSRGCARLQGIVGDPQLWTATVASVFLGPFDDGTVVPGPFLLLAATGDLQSKPAIWEAAWDRQGPPKWKIVIQGGNHSLFSDHKVWLGPLLDEAPTIDRSAQFGVVASFVLPLLERAFGMAEHFPERLDAPPADPLYDAEWVAD